MAFSDRALTSSLGNALQGDILRPNITPEIAAAATLVLLGSSVFILLNQLVAKRDS